MKIEVTEGGVNTGTWFEIEEAWTRKEARSLDEATLAEIFDDWLPKKVLDMEVVLPDGTLITDPSTIAFESDWVDELDQRVYGIMGNMLHRAVQTLFFSMTRNVSISFDGTESKTSRKKKLA